MNLGPIGTVGCGEIESGHAVRIEERSVCVVREEETDKGGVISV